MKRGFTLIELSIVLVIIGLLIGGILVAQSMLDNVRANRVIKKLQQVDIAIRNFQNQYKSLPGDSDLIGNPGNNNGVVDSTEAANVNEQLFKAGFISPAIYTAESATPDSCGANGFLTLLGKSEGARKDYVCYGYRATVANMQQNTWTSYFSGPAKSLSTKIIGVVDYKIDDGKPTIITSPNGIIGYDMRIIQNNIPGIASCTALKNYECRFKFPGDTTGDSINSFSDYGFIYYISPAWNN